MYKIEDFIGKKNIRKESEVKRSSNKVKKALCLRAEGYFKKFQGELNLLAYESSFEFLEYCKEQFGSITGINFSVTMNGRHFSCWNEANSKDVYDLYLN